MVSIDRIERTKENIVSSFPAESLVNYQDPVQRAELGNLLAAIPTATQDSADPLAIHLAYIDALRGCLPRSWEIMNAFDACTREFSTTSKYRQDIRLLRVWLEYISFSSAPLEQFAWMFSAGVGTERALFYEEWSAVYEHSGSIAKARLVLQRGIELHAKPTENLEAAIAELDQRASSNQVISSQLLSSSPSSLAARTDSRKCAGPIKDSRPPKRFKVFEDAGASRDEAIIQACEHRSGIDSNERVTAPPPQIRAARKENRAPARSIIPTAISPASQSTSLTNRNEATTLQRLVSVYHDPQPSSSALDTVAIDEKSNAILSEMPTAGKGERLMIRLPDKTHSIEELMLEARGWNHRSLDRCSKVLVQGPKADDRPSETTEILAPLFFDNQHAQVTEKIFETTNVTDKTEQL